MDTIQSTALMRICPTSRWASQVLVRVLKTVCPRRVSQRHATSTPRCVIRFARKAGHSSPVLGSPGKLILPEKEGEQIWTRSSIAKSLNWSKG